MKNYFLTGVFILTIGISAIYGQGQTWDGLVKMKEKSDKEITTSKAEKSKTWYNRAKLYFEIATFNTTGLYIGMPAKQIKDDQNSIFSNAELVVGKPNGVKANGDEEVWEYPEKNLYFKNGRLERWEETKFIDKEALIKSADAFIKADEKDPKKKLKEKAGFQQDVMFTRNAIDAKAIDLYTYQKFDESYKYIIKTIELGVFPKHKDDTFYTEAGANYKAGIIAYNGEKYDNAIKHFDFCIKNKHEGGNSYGYKSKCYIEQGDTVKGMKIIEDGIGEYPDNLDLIIAKINDFIIKKMDKEAIEYLDKAIMQNPDNYTFYNAKATVYEGMISNHFDEYKRIRNEEEEKYKKEAFKVRFDKAKCDPLKAKQAEAEKKAKDYYDKEITPLVKQTEDLYLKALQIEPTFFNAAFNLGVLYYSSHERRAWQADFVYRIYKSDDKERAEKETAEYTKLKEDDLATSGKYFEQAHNIDPKDIATLKNLKMIYYKIGSKDNYEKNKLYKKKLEELQN